jgi:hypothetical protein
MSLKERIAVLLSANECQGAFNAHDALSKFTFREKDFTMLKAWLINDLEVEVLASQNAMILFEGGIIKGISTMDSIIMGRNDMTDFKTVRGQESDYVGPLLDGFL